MLGEVSNARHVRKNVMFGDTLFRLINIAGGLGLKDDLWQRQVVGMHPATARRASRQRIAQVAEARRQEAMAPLQRGLIPRAALISWW